MANPSVALLMPNLNALNKVKRGAFLLEVDKSMPAGTIVLLDGKSMPQIDGLVNLRLILFSHGNEVGDTLRRGLAAAMELSADKMVTFEDYSLSNANWFKPYLDIGNVIESKKRGFVEALVTEITNILSFCNAYNGFSMNRIFTKEAAAVIKETKLKGKAFFVESNGALNAKGIKTIEVIKNERKQTKSGVGVNDAVSSIIKSLNRSSILFALFNSLAYIANLSAVYLSLSLGWFYPLAVVIGGEVNTLSNFIMNEKINFKNRGFLSSVYRLGKFNALTLIPIMFDIFLIGYLSRYTNLLGKDLFTDISIVSIMVVSLVSFFIVTKIMWVKENHVRVQV